MLYKQEAATKKKKRKKENYLVHWEIPKLQNITVSLGVELNKKIKKCFVWPGVGYKTKTVQMTSACWEKSNFRLLTTQYVFKPYLHK